MKEIWKDIEGYEGLYQVSSLGRVKSFHYHNGTNERILKSKTKILQTIHLIIWNG